MEGPSCRAAVPTDQQPMIIQWEERSLRQTKGGVGWAEVGILQDHCDLEAMARRKLARWRRSWVGSQERIVSGWSERPLTISLFFCPSFSMVHFIFIFLHFKRIPKKHKTDLIHMRRRVEKTVASLILLPVGLPSLPSIRRAGRESWPEAEHLLTAAFPFRVLSEILSIHTTNGKWDYTLSLLFKRTHAAGNTGRPLI